MISVRTFIGTPGDNDISHPSLSGTEVYAVFREGTLFTEVDPVGLPVGMEFIHVESRIIFDLAMPFFGNITDDLRETVTVLYET